MGSDKSSEVYPYVSDSPIYAMNWSVRRDKKFRLGIASFKEEANNYVELIELDESLDRFVSNPSLRFKHEYPATKLMFVPDKEGVGPDLLATTGEFLRLWRITEDRVNLEKVFNNKKQSEFSAPLTSFDWNELDPKRIGTSSIDTTCTIWDLERGEVDTQLIAHDKEVYDIAWGGTAVFATVSADGSVRVFDLRDRENSTIIFESPQPDVPLVRLAWNRMNPCHLATLPLNSSKAILLDIRLPTFPVAELGRHKGHVNALAWAPHSARHICTAGDDCQAFIWDLDGVKGSVTGVTGAATTAVNGASGSSSTLAPNGENAVSGESGAPSDAAGSGVRGANPILAYKAKAEINQLQWSAASPDWISICYQNVAQILKV
uniref:Uncharacterized protein n=1 Tax=Polytomella parva TaxID=51329 RepID=A0A7S0UYS2_9CHLO|mmetsp:Transcript_22737/g.40244  ORF Transcript_22737/g.40244 Transcript_22737/m.40244 type:complete len:376 (+) Transcript_22737:141-1268(+)|eukprot:CAMPEP_0175052106 /NCGR_PEP_ID=MMETSP0052_2-20121109/8177_1 /TAXON_ID=51329 ORGANISM="Polytomella parva, Strain SAG 63-3" /NCGR_SAMPLE_ID=MMETSP0052_2 /ASSEMBLY_ACC=CAM_ASM_000194 /LENGTH=375 /DNA_ID=CAMNT_0016316477 /DNA_START=39 /DNA_END=1166 /DNA_ORIENTATION=+